MKRIQTSNGKFGYFINYQILEDRIVADGVVYPFVVIGKDFTIIEEDMPSVEPVYEVPQTITPRQLRLQLLSVGLLDDVEALCATDRAMSIWFEYSLDFQRNHEMIIAMGTQLGMSESDMDNFFIEANKL